MGTKDIPPEENRGSIKYYVKRYLVSQRERIRGKVVVDVPAGSGVTSAIVRDLGGIPLPFDLFPEYFRTEGLICRRANLLEGIPLEDGAADVVLCQEGIEHLPDQLKAFREFNRLLRINGSLILTTPNYSNLRGRLSYFLAESERSCSAMPPNEVDSVWMSKAEITSELYFGHIFLLGIQKLRVLGRLTGFRVEHIEFTQWKNSALLLLPFAYPFILLSNWYAYWRGMRTSGREEKEARREVYREILRFALDPRILIDGHLFVEFRKEQQTVDVPSGLRSVHQEFGAT